MDKPVKRRDPGSEIITVEFPATQNGPLSFPPKSPQKRRGSGVAP